MVGSVRSGIMVKVVVSTAEVAGVVCSTTVMDGIRFTSVVDVASSTRVVVVICSGTMGDVSRSISAVDVTCSRRMLEVL